MMRHSFGPLLAGGDPRPRGVVVGLDLHGHDRIVLNVEEPAGWIAAVGGHDQEVVSVRFVDQRRGPLGTRSWWW
jgi:hypothetical protein